MYIDPVAATWQKSSFCNGASSCVEVSSLDGCVLVRDSKLGDASPVLRFTVGQWWSFIAATKSRHGYSGPVVVAGAYDSWHAWHADDPAVVLDFDRTEIDAFLAGVNAGEFKPDVLASGGDVPGRPPALPLAGFGADSAPA